MPRYKVRLEDLAGALRALGVVVPERPLPAPEYLEIELEPVPYTVRRSEPFREAVDLMVAKGYSNRRIAEELNDLAMYGPNGGLWHSSSIKRLRARLGV